VKRNPGLSRLLLLPIGEGGPGRFATTPAPIRSLRSPSATRISGAPAAGMSA